MKKVTLIAVALVLFLGGCTVQTTLSPPMFIERFGEKYPEFTLDTDNAFYENDKFVLFAENRSGRRFAIEMTVDSAGRVQKISLACIETDKAYEFYSFAECVADIYAPQEDFLAAAKKIFDGKDYSYYETQSYYYCFSQNEAGLCFTVEDKRFAPPKDEGLTLKENGTVTSR